MMVSNEYEKTAECKPLEILRSFLTSKYFPFITAAYVLLFYYLGLDLVIIAYMGICGTLILLFLEDITPLITVFLFMDVMISRQNSPTNFFGNPSDYYFRTEVLVPIYIIVAIFALAVVYRIVVSIKKNGYKLTPTFYGLCVFSVALLLNGLLSDNIKPMNMIFGFILSFFYLGIFILVTNNIKITKRTFEYIAWAFIAVSLIVAIEVIVLYATTEGIVVDGRVNRSLISTGWGMYNTIGMMLTISIPSAFYLAGKYKHGWLFTLYAIAVLTAAWFTMSRQSMLGSSFIFACCAVMLLLKGKNKIINCSILSVFAVVLLVLLVADGTKVTNFFSIFFTSFGDGSGRLGLYKLALEVFKKYPIFGQGFYVELAADPGFAGLPLIPDMYHDTFMQLLAATGAVGLIAYGIHRGTTVISYIKNITVERTYIAFIIIALLFLNLFDNHIFYLFPSLIYGFLIGIFVGSEDRELMLRNEKMLSGKNLAKE